MHDSCHAFSDNPRPRRGGKKLAAVFLTILLALAVCGCQFPYIGKKDTSAAKPSVPNPCVVLALPASGPFAPIAARIKNGAAIAQQELKATGVDLRLENINTEAPDWLNRLEALPRTCAIVGGPMQDKKYVAARKSGVLEKRTFFSFMPTLQAGDEGKLAWRFFPSPQDQIDALVRFAADEMNIRTFGSFYPSDNYGQRMTLLLENTLARQNMPLQKASYNPSAPATWIDALKPLIQPTSSDNGKTVVPQTMFEAIFLPDSWKHMDMLVTSLLYNGEDRLVLLGTTLWEQSLSDRQIPKAARYALAVFPGAWNREKAPEKLKGQGNDFWKALGYDFVNFAVNAGMETRLNAAETTSRAQRAAGTIRGMAPITWDGNGIARQRLYLFQVAPAGMKPLNVKEFRQTRAAALERAALRMQGGASTDPETVNPPESPEPAEPLPATMRQGAAITPASAPGAVQQGAPLRSTPQPSYKLRLPDRR